MRSWPFHLIPLVLAACAGSPAPAPATAISTQTSTVETAMGPAQLPAEVVHPRLRERLEEITADAMRADLEWIVGPRVAGDPHHDEVVERAEAELRQLGFITRRQTVLHGTQRADNLIAERVGRDPSRLVVLGAHYDTVPGSPGADDNASGVAALLAAARTLAMIRTEATVQLVLFCLEEVGLRGSEAFVAALPDTEPEGRHLEVAVIVDMLGYASDEPGSQRWPEGVELLAGGRSIPRVGDFMGAFWLTDTSPEVVSRFEAASEYEPTLDLQTLAIPRVVLEMAPDLLRSDHAPFWRAGLPAISVGDTGPFRNPSYHSATDTLETLDLEFLARVSRWLSASLISLAEVAQAARDEVP